jgi:hypothetical protein
LRPERAHLLDLRDRGVGHGGCGNSERGWPHERGHGDRVRRQDAIVRIRCGSSAAAAPCVSSPRWQRDRAWLTNPQTDGMVKVPACPHRWQQMLEKGEYGTLAELASAKRLSSGTFSRRARGDSPELWGELQSARTTSPSAAATDRPPTRTVRACKAGASARRAMSPRRAATAPADTVRPWWQ